MKIKSVLAAIVAAAALSCTAVCAFADDATPTDDQISVESEVTADGENEAETTSDDEGEPASDGEDGSVSNDEAEPTSDSENEVSSVPENVTEAADPMEGNPISGVDGAAALAGIAMVAGAALVISHKRV